MRETEAVAKALTAMIIATAIILTVAYIFQI
jgi:flagellar biogenesis protein FliO